MKPTQQVEIKIHPAQLDNPEACRAAVAKKLRCRIDDLPPITLIRRSIDARGKEPVFMLRYEVGNAPEKLEILSKEKLYRDISAQSTCIIIGFGPGGMFAALKLIELGIKPIVIERGEDVRGRRRDIAKINKEGFVNPESNYCFGEGGAGTFSDGKLYTRSLKRGNTLGVLQRFVMHGATNDILLEAHPHIGTNKLPGIVESMRETILNAGGEIHFNTRMEELILEKGEIKGVKCANGKEFLSDAVILATGHSARDIYHLLDKQNIALEAKSFAMGVRVEHPQSAIDRIQYRSSTRHPNLPAASYSLVRQVEGRGVYSFCMCPGGIICPASTSNDEVVVNGWSPSKRDSPYANSGIVVEITPEDLQPHSSAGIFAGLELQKQLEQAAFNAGGGKQVAPAQRLIDFVKNRTSSDLPNCSYLPGLNSTDLHAVLTPAISSSLKEGFRAFGKRLKGYFSQEAVVVGVESRTSSPIRIPRDKETLMHPQVKGLYPCGEGAGYAGGIMSAAMDGEKCAIQATEWVKSK